MDHIIIQVRDAIRAQLTNLAVTQGNVFLYSEAAFDESHLPLLAIEYQEDSAEPIGLGFPAAEDLGPVYQVHILVKQKGDYEQAAFLVRNQVESALFGTREAKTLGGLVQWVRRVSAECARDESVDKPVYRLTLQLQAKVRHFEAAPESGSLSS
jgi:hypothetical protein